MIRRFLFVLGTRPEAIKQAPLILACQAGVEFEVRVCHSGQHGAIVCDVLAEFGIAVDYQLKLTRDTDSLSDLVSVLLSELKPIFVAERFDGVIVQGDTATAFAASLCATYLKLPVIHIESGLRSFDRQNPFPEEVNRILIDQLALIHFAPTDQAVENLRLSGIVENVYQVGNPVIDALKLALREGSPPLKKGLSVVVTAHRRESWGEPISQICLAITQLAETFPEIEFRFCLPPNPVIQKDIRQALSLRPNIVLSDPLSYFSFVQWLCRADLIMTDSGGIQEEASFLAKPLLVMRDQTERQEVLQTGQGELVGRAASRIYDRAAHVLRHLSRYHAQASANLSYGEGDSAEKMKRILVSLFN